MLLCCQNDSCVKMHNFFVDCVFLNFACLNLIFFEKRGGFFVDFVKKVFPFL